MSTCSLPLRSTSNRCSASASIAAGFYSTSVERQRADIAPAPASSASVSTPPAAAGNNPTAVSTEKRPPTSGGTGSVGQPSLVATARRAPLLGSVTATTLPGPLAMPWSTVSSCAQVSAVPPLLVIA